MARHHHNDACRRRMLFMVLSLSLCVIASLEAQEKTLLPDDLACPVTPNLFPEQIQGAGSIRFIFPMNAIPCRISIALIHPENRDVDVKYSWMGILFWGTYSGVFVSKGNGKPNCFFFDRADIPVNVACREFTLKVPEGIRVLEVAFSSLSSEKPEVLCPMPELENEIDRAYSDCELDLNDKNKASVLIQLLERATPKYDCRGPHPRPVPAWWLANHEGPWRWIHYLYDKVLENNNEALLVYEKFLATSDGAFAEVMSEQMWGFLHDRPLFILENWTGIENNKEWVLIARPWPSQGNKNISEMIEIYRDIAIKEPKYKSACDEIISILSEKGQTSSR